MNECVRTGGLKNSQNNLPTSPSCEDAINKFPNMENTYGIGVTNRFELFLDDESDPLEALKLKEREKELKKKSKVAEKENKAKTEVQPKSKPAPTQKKVVKEPPVHNKPQENKRDGEYLSTAFLDPRAPRSDRRSLVVTLVSLSEVKPVQRTDSKQERSHSKFTNDTREERNNRRNREEKPYNGPVESNR